MLYSAAVPAPIVNLTKISSSTLFAGTNLSLICTFELHSAADSQVTLNSVWRRGGQILNSNSRVNISTTHMTSPLTYSTTLQISPLSNTMDGGQYSCQSIISSEPYILYTDASRQATVRIEGTINIILIILRLKDLHFCFQSYHFQLLSSPAWEGQLQEKTTPFLVLYHSLMVWWMML